jgi:hypothetical protein
MRLTNQTENISPSAPNLTGADVYCLHILWPAKVLRVEPTAAAPTYRL